MYCSADSVGKTVLLTVHLDPGVGTYPRRSCLATSLGWSCQDKGHRWPWDPQPHTKRCRPPAWAYFQQCCLQALGGGGFEQKLVSFCCLQCCRGAQVCSHFCSAPETPGHGSEQLRLCPFLNQSEQIDRNKWWWLVEVSKAETLSVRNPAGKPQVLWFDPHP